MPRAAWMAANSSSILASFPLRPAQSKARAAMGAALALARASAAASWAVAMTRALSLAMRPARATLKSPVRRSATPLSSNIWPRK